MMWRQ